jgi:hypothetical protein
MSSAVLGQGSQRAESRVAKSVALLDEITEHAILETPGQRAPLD